jgi:hypothetical protein
LGIPSFFLYLFIPTHLSSPNMRTKSLFFVLFVLTKMLGAQSMWTRMNTGIICSPYYLRDITSDGAHLYLASQECGVFINTIGDSTWTPVNNGRQCLEVMGIGANSSTILTGGGASSFCGIARSTNQGASWTTVDSTLTLSKFVFDGDTVFAAGYSGVYKSTNNGNSWIPLLPGISGSSILINGTDLVVGENNNGIYISNDRGMTWHTSNTGLNNLLVRCLASSGSVLYAGTYGGGLYSSVDDGLTWNTTGASSGHIMTVNASGSSVFIGLIPPIGPGGGTHGIYYSPDNGDSFYGTGEPFTDAISSIVVESEVYMVHFYGEVLKADISGFAVGLKAFADPATDHTIAPNPFSESTKITFEGDGKNRIIRVIDLMGKEVFRTSCNEKELILERNALPAGVYFVEINDQEKNKSTQKIVIH